MDSNHRCVSAACEGGQVVWGDGTEFVLNTEVVQSVLFDNNSNCVMAIWLASTGNIAVHDEPCTLQRTYLCEMYF